jgi:hypothetical protein
MLHYRLRTLFVGLTCIAAVFGWLAFLRSKANFHRREAARQVSLVSFKEGINATQAEAVLEIAGDAFWCARVINADDDEGLRIFWNCFFDNHQKSRREVNISEPSVKSLQSAFRHQMLANEYARAITHPWDIQRTARLIVYDRQSDDIPACTTESE